MNETTATAAPPVNKLGDPVLRCEFCRSLIGRVHREGIEAVREAEPAKISLDPDFIEHRLFQFCTTCRVKYLGNRSDGEFMKKKWVAIDYMDRLRREGEVG